MTVVKAVESTSDCISQSKVGAITQLESDSFVSDQMHEFDRDVSASNGNSDDKRSQDQFSDTDGLLEINECISVETDSTISDYSTEDCQVGIPCHEDIQDVSDISCNVNQFNSGDYQSGPAIVSLYEGSSITLLEAIAEYLHWFTKHPGTSKQALSEILYMQHHTILPKDNMLPDSYKKAIRIVKSYLVEPTLYDVCPNDCIIYRNHMSDLEKCPKCNTERFKSNGSVRPRSLCYLPLGPRLMRLFGTSNLAKLVQEHGKVSHSPVMHDIHDAPVRKDAYE